MDPKGSYRSSTGSISTFCTTRRAPIRAIGLALAVAVMMAMLAPLLAQPAAAAENDDTPTRRGRIAATTDTPAINATLVAQGEGGDGGMDEVPPAEEDEVDDFVAVPLDPLPNTINVVKYDCADDYDGDYNLLLENCHEPDYSVPFALYGEGVEEYYDGGIATEGFYTGSFQVYEDVPAGYGAPVVYCGIYSGDSAVALSWYDVADGGIGFDLAEGFSIYCAWFNVPDHDGGDVTIVINKRYCEEGFAAYEATYEELASACYNDHDGVWFGIYNGGEIAGGETVDGVVQFDGLPTGDHAVAELAPEGYHTPIVFCVLTDAAGFVHGLVDIEIDVDGEYYFFGQHFNAGDILVCDWFNVPDNDHEDGTVTVIKHFCPEYLDIDPYSAYLDQLLEACPELHDDVTFDLFHQGNDLLETRVTGFDGDPGVAYWDEVASGELSIDEHLPSGYGKPVVYCDTYYPFDEQIPAYEWLDADGAQIEYDLAEGYSLVCHWFNIPEYEDDSTVTVTKWICPDGYDYDDLAELDLYELQALCDEVHVNVNFDLNGDSETTDDAGQVSWDGLDLGDYDLSEFIPHGYGEPIVWCGFSAYHDGAIYDGFPQQVDLADSTTFAFEIAIPNSDWFCFWFNIPTDDGGEIVVTKWVCPEGYDAYELSLHELYDLCQQVHEGVDFHLFDGDGASSMRTTGGDGQATWDNPDANEYGLWEDVPHGYGEPIIFCGWTSVADGAYFDDTAEPVQYFDGNPGVEFEIGHDWNWFCDWFNIPTEDEDDPAKLTVIKYWCDGDYVSALNCAVYGGGQQFLLGAASGEGDPYEFTTGGDGAYTLELPAGAWDLIEVGGEWCKAESDDVNGLGQIETWEGHESVVKVYNCGDDDIPNDDPPTKQPPVKGLPNTGSGDAASGLAAGGNTGTVAAAAAAAQLFGLVALAAIRNRRQGQEVRLAA